VERRALRSSADQGSLSVFGPPVLFPGEDQRSYDEIAGETFKAVAPIDFIEKMLTRDVIDLECEVLRWRRVKAGLFASALAENLENALNSQGVQVSKGFVNAWLRREAAAIDRMARLVNERKLDLERAKADCLIDCLDSIDKIDDQITKAEARRNAHLREIGRHREVLAFGLSQAVTTIGADLKSRAA
jgi:hypothetical protein